MLKDEGNKLVAAKKLEQAIDCYSKAIELDPKNHVLYSNRSGAHLENGNATAAIADAKLCVSLEPTWAKGYYRLGSALEAVKEWNDAELAYSRGLELDATNRDLLKGKDRASKGAAQTLRQQAGQERANVNMDDCIRTANERVEAAALPQGPKIETLVAAHSDVVRLERRPGKGRCLVAARDIKALDTLILEPAVAWYAPLGDILGGLIPGLLEHRKDLTQAEVDAIILQLAPHAPESKADSDGAAALPTTMTRAELIIPAAAQNVLGATFDEDLSADEKRVMCFCPVVDMCNSDCAPSCTYVGYWDSKHHCPGIRLVAERDIAAGEEITICYANRAEARDERIKRLQKYGFTCGCARCSSSIDDSTVFRCPKCKDGRIYLGSRACADCGQDVGDEAQPGGSLQAAAAAWLAAHSDNVLAICRPKQDDPCPLHPSDQQLLSQVYGSLGSVWGMAPAVRCVVMRWLVASPANHVRGPGFTWDLFLLSGHMHSMAGDVSTAQSHYGQAAKLASALFGPTSLPAMMADACSKRPPTSQQEVGTLEVKRQRLYGSWLAQGLAQKTYDRWRRPLDPAGVNQETYPRFQEALQKIARDAMERAR